MIKFGLIGCGNVSNIYLYTLKRNKNSEVIALADIDLNKARKNAEIFGIKSVYSSYKEMLEREKINAVVICTPHYLHYEQFMECAKKKLDVLCEKPLAVNIRDIEDMIEKGRSIKFGVMLQRRFYPNSELTRNVINKGLLGKIEEVSLDFRCHKTPEFYDSWRGKKISGGGTLISQALHRIDQLVYFFGPAENVDGIIKTTRDYIEVEDYAIGKISFGNNIIANIESNNSTGDSETISTIKIKGTKGIIVLSDDKTLEWGLDIPKPEEISINNIPPEYRPVHYGPAHELVIDNFVDAVLYDKPVKVSGEDSLEAMKIIFGFYKSAKEKRKIYIDEI